MKKEDRIDDDFIEDIRQNLIDIETFVQGINFQEFQKNKEKQNAVIFSLGAIGEAVKNLSADLKNQYPQVPWKEAAGLRDKLFHGYWSIDLEIIWNVITIDIPVLKKEIDLI